MPIDRSSPIRLGWLLAPLRWLGFALLGLWFAFAAVVLVLRYQVLPDIDRYRPDLERAVSRSLGLGVSIGSLRAGWDGLRPDLTLGEVRIANRRGETVLAFSRVDAVLSWQSLVALELRLHRLAIDSPVLHVQREADGRLLVAGMPIEDQEQQQDGSLVDWLLRQRGLVIHDASLIWEDAQRGAPPLFLEHADFRLENRGSRHRFGLTGKPPAALAGRLDVRGELRGREIGKPAEWRGTLYAESDGIDLAGWRPWFDYPFELPQGHGGLRLWFGVEQGKAQELTADLALRDVRLRLASQLPELDIEQMHGRLRGKRQDKGFALAARALSLTTRDGLVLPETHFDIDWQREADAFVRGRAAANAIDLDVLRRLTATLPLDERTRGLLADFAPRGRIADLKATWRANSERADKFSIKANFEDLGAKASGLFPGFAGLTGNIEASESEGRIALRAGPATLEMPAVFPEPVLAFDELGGAVRWKIQDGFLDADLQQASFTAVDAVGSAQGHYRRALVDGGAGTIDLTAKLEQADARSVWRYLPHLVAPSARAWVKRGVVAGNASSVQLTLKGDLERFPFRNPQDGKFLVVAKAANAVIDYADGWPRVNAIDGTLRFEGARMLVEAQRGTILGTQVKAARVEIPDLVRGEPRVLVNGVVEGPTTEFLRFIETSPVGDWLGHFSADMRASGNGRLDLGLTIPLDHLKDTQVKGDYQFLANEVVIDPALPPITQVDGRLSFTEADVVAREITGSALGFPLKVGVRMAGDRVIVNAQGGASIAQLRKTWDWRLFDHASGSAPWRAEVRARKKQLDVVVDSSLQGVSSSLPAPFNKTAADVLPLHVEKSLQTLESARKGPPPARDHWKVTLGRLASAQFVRRIEGERAVVEQAALAVGEPLRLPESGFALNVSQPRLDLDAWRALLPPASSAGKGGGDELPSPVVSLRAAQATAFGRDWHDASLRAMPTAEGFQGRVEAREISGEWVWSQVGKGRLRARLKRFALPANGEAAAGRGTVSEALDSLPALDVVSDQFSYGEHPLGRLELDATNEGRVWQINRLQLANPDGVLGASGRWRFSGGERTQLSFEIEARDVGRLLARFGQPDAIRGGTAHVDGRLSWQGAPTTIDYASLGGDLRLTAEKGQFAKLEPGIGKLFSLLSLQMLPRRITLDFRDVFSEGFAFDSISGEMAVSNGIMKTDNLIVEGPAAKVLMRGDVDLQRETQNLRVAIQPQLGGTVALGAAVVNPIAGIAALLAQKILQDPLNKAFAFEYAVTGSWADPKVEKLSWLVRPQEKQ